MYFNFDEKFASDVEKKENRLFIKNDYSINRNGQN